MANEITAWKKENCSLTLKTNILSQRETFSMEINEIFGEGGGLNADYRTVEAVAKVSNILGLNNLIHRKHFVFKTGGIDCVSFDFCDKETREKAEKILKEQV